MINKLMGKPTTKPIKGVALPDYLKPGKSGSGMKPTTKPIKGVPTPSYAK
jgi:hypothetical protein